MHQHYIPPEDDILFVLEHVLKWRELLQTDSHSCFDGDLAAAIISEGARFCASELSPLNAQGDREGCSLVAGDVMVPKEFQRVFRLFSEGGWLGLDQPSKVGGQGLPYTLGNAISEMVNGSCVAFGMMPCMSKAAAELLIEHASKAVREDIVPQILSGKIGATIVITEPQAGSSVREIRTTAVKQQDGSYRLTGEKMFITCGDQNYTDQIVHIVLAKVKDAKSEGALTLFLVPKYEIGSRNKRNGVVVTRLESKMGLKGSPTCALSFDAAKGVVIGQEGRGLQALFTMMNLMRLEVAIQGVGIASAATQKAVAYASERKQGGNPDRGIVQFADVQCMLNEMQALTQGMRALVMDVSLHVDMARCTSNKKKKSDAQAYVHFLLPVCKAWVSDQSFKVANIGVQVLGGHGYVADNGMEQFVRDCRVLSIYEGTNGIQALDLVLRKLLNPDEHGYDLMRAKITKTLDDVKRVPNVQFLAQELEQGLSCLERATQVLRAAKRVDAEAGARAYLHLTGNILCGWMWLRIASVDGNLPAFPRKNKLAEFYFRYLLPECELLERRVLAGAFYVEHF